MLIHQAGFDTIWHISYGTTVCSRFQGRVIRYWRIDPPAAARRTQKNHLQPQASYFFIDLRPLSGKYEKKGRAFLRTLCASVVKCFFHFADLLNNGFTTEAQSTQRRAVFVFFCR